MSKDKEMEEFYKSVEGLTLIEVSAIMNDMRIKLDAAKDVKTKYQKKYDALRLNIVPPLMDDEDITSITIDGIGRVGLTSDIYASIVSGEKEKAFSWLRENRHGDAIQETVNSGTLKALLKGIIKKGEEVIPEDVFKVTPFSRASITKK